MKLIPLYDRVVVKPSESDNKTESGLYLPENSQPKPQTGLVIEVGEGRCEDGKTIPLLVKKMDKVLFQRYSGLETELNKEKVIVLKESDILAIVK